MISNYQKYYTEIKNRILLILFAWLLCLNICYYYKETILFILVNSNNSLLELDNKPYFIFTNVTEIFYVYLELILFVANQIALIILIYQILMFLALGLYQFEFLKLKFAFQIFTITWLFSFLLLLNVIVPFSWNFFLSFQEKMYNSQSIDLFFEAKLSEYLQYFISLYYICLINCQFLTVLVVTLTNLSEKLKKTKIFRKLFYLIFVVFSTIVTPPDILSQLCISSFLILLYEFLILLREIKINMATS